MSALRIEWKQIADMGRYFWGQNRIVMNPVPDLWIWELFPELKTIIHIFNVTLLHELAHWAGHRHKDMNESWIWNEFIEKKVA